MIKLTNLSNLSPYGNSFCVDARPCNDVDGDTEVKCVHNGNCCYQKIVKDADGDTKVMCNKY